MSYVPFTEKSAAEVAADRKADEQWMRDHKPVTEMAERPVWGAARLVGHPAPSAH